MRKLNSQIKELLYFIGIPAIITGIIFLDGYRRFGMRDMKSIFIIFGGLCFFWIAINVIMQTYIELFVQFIKEDVRGKVIMILILLSVILKVIYEIRLNN